ncbi:hypothetical protein BGLT_02233 [Caballeronia glathei]|nr:hypothetical protein [Caballeronia glathei]CDY79452.1 hypothetical protein BGLT_02233 [Caballeronia glathei]
MTIAPYLFAIGFAIGGILSTRRIGLGDWRYWSIMALVGAAAVVGRVS